jgi:Ca2+-binding EF-hand superfamily protein
MVSTIHKALNKLAKSKNGAPQFRKVFASLDKDGSGHIDTSEFIIALGGMG